MSLEARRVENYRQIAMVGVQEDVIRPLSDVGEARHRMN